MKYDEYETEVITDSRQNCTLCQQKKNDYYYDDWWSYCPLCSIRNKYEMYYCYECGEWVIPD